MAEFKKHIALFSMSLALVALLMHGIIPHHHHDFEAERCNIEIQTSNGSAPEIVCSDTTCEICADKTPGATRAHTCTINVSESKQILVALAIVIGFGTFQNSNGEPDVHFPLYSEPVYNSVSSIVCSLRAPPLT